MTGASKHLSKLLASALVALLTATSVGRVGREGPWIQFENRQPGSGVTFVLDNGTLPDKPMIDGIPGGVALFDYDGGASWRNGTIWLRANGISIAQWS